MGTRGLSKGVVKAINTMKKHKEYMLNAVKYDYSNGPLEGFNNKIKLLKRVSYGYSSFSNFRLRILIMSRLFISKHKNTVQLSENKKNLSSTLLPRFSRTIFSYYLNLAKSLFLLYLYYKGICVWRIDTLLLDNY